MGIGPYERSQEVQWLLGGAMWASPPTKALQGVRASGASGTPPPTEGYKRCGGVKNPPVTAAPCQPPLGKGAMKTGDADCRSRCAHWLRNDSFFARGQCKAGRRGGGHPALRRGYKKCSGAGRCGGERPLRMCYKGCGENGGFIGGLPGEGQREGNFWLNLGEGREIF